MIRSDNGTKYTSNKFSKFCEDARIEQQLTIPYTPQQNSVNERKNRTIMEMAKCLLFEKKLPKKFWAKTVNTSVYLLSRLSMRSVKEKTPFKAWFNIKPVIKYVKVFGSVFYVHIFDAKRSKLDEKAAVEIFVVYGTSTKGY